MHRFFYFALLVLTTTTTLATCNDITTQVFGNTKEGIVAAFGDFNSDELTDVFIIREQKSILQILFGADTEPLLQTGPYCTFDGYEIISIVPGDFDGDALMDVLVVLHPKSGGQKNIHEIYVNWGELNSINCSKTGNPLLKTEGEPLALDYDQNMVIDLYGLNEFSERTFWIFSAERPRSAPTFVRQMPPTGSSKFKALIHTPNANAYLDLNNDFIADLFVQTDKFYEIWDGHKDKDFVFNRTIDFVSDGAPEYTIGQAVFADFELEGVEDIILPVCFNHDCLKSAIMMYDGKNMLDLHVGFKDHQGMLWTFVPPIEDDVYLRTITARSGDYNMDGYPDLIMTLQTTSGPKRLQTFLLENVPCNVACNKLLKRTFEVKWNALYPLGNNTVAGAFYDFYQDGVLDVILIEKNKAGNYRPLAFRNTLDYDANFVKVIVLTGLSNKKNPTQRTPLGYKKRTYGTNLPGPRIIYTTTTQEGDMQRGSSVQLPQSAYFALQLPYTIFGLGRTPNFVDSLTVGLGGKSRTWTQLIPNSQIIVVPMGEERYWKAQLFVTPSKLILMSVIALGGTCLVIVLIILVLYIKEKREDKQEKLQEAHRFHFDAM